MHFQGNHVNWTIYNLNWYNYSNIEKRMFLIMLVRNCIPAGFYALDYIECNLQTFQYVACIMTGYYGDSNFGIFFVDYVEGFLRVHLSQ